MEGFHLLIAPVSQHSGLNVWNGTAVYKICAGGGVVPCVPSEDASWRLASGDDSVNEKMEWCMVIMMHAPVSRGETDGMIMMRG